MRVPQPVACATGCRIDELAPLVTRLRQLRATLTQFTPKELGGAGGAGTNPEQLFAAGCSACFIGAMKAVAARQKIALSSEVSIKAEVSIGPMTGKEGAFGIAVAMAVSVPGM